MSIDPRVWSPDQSCAPFQIQTSIAATDRLMLRFSVPTGVCCVIASAYFQEQSVLDRKRIKYLVQDAFEPIPTDETFPMITYPLHGCLTDVLELDGEQPAPGSLNWTPGFAQTGLIAVSQGLTDLPHRVLLKAGSYQIVRHGPVAILVAVCRVFLSGWTFPVAES